MLNLKNIKVSNKKKIVEVLKEQKRKNDKKREKYLRKFQFFNRSQN